MKSRRHGMRVDMEYIREFCWEASWKMSTWKTEKEVRELINIDLREICFLGGLWMELTWNCASWHVLVLVVLKLQVVLP
jgi:hypothetical protein